MGSIVVLSPHSDDGVFSLGASMARWARSGRHVELLTVLALDPASNAPAAGWDRRAGFLTEGDAARARREEDCAACAILGVTPRWLPFGSVDFDRHGSDTEVWDAVRGVVGDASVVLTPGSPLTHPDHAWLNRLVCERSPSFPVVRYAEQPYTFKARGMPFDPAEVGLRDRIAKWRGIRAYRSQLPLLAMRRSIRNGPLRLSWAEERVESPEGRVDLPL